ncbi:MAG: hypothetical protein ACRDYC_04590 [Acidimicrobiales bacterium]
MNMITSARASLSVLRSRVHEAEQGLVDVLSRARRGEPVSAAELSEARALVELAGLPLEGAEAAALAEREAELAEQRRVAVERHVADETVACQAFLHTLIGLRSALIEVQTAALAHEAVLRQTKAEMEILGGDDRFDDLYRGGLYAQAAVRRRPLRSITTRPWLEAILAEVRGQPFGTGDLYPQPTERTAL